MFAYFRLDGDISPLFPYINAAAKSARLVEKPPFIRFVLNNVCCGLYPDHGAAASFTNSHEALEFLDRPYATSWSNLLIHLIEKNILS